MIESNKAGDFPLDEASHPALPAELTAEMTRLFNAGFSLIPLGGEDGKKAIIRYANRKRPPLQVVTNRLLAGGGRSYGIRLSGLLVVDVDTDTPEARAYVQSRFGSSPARTITKRGFHLFFRHVGERPADVDLYNIRIQFKSGDNAYVVGPGSVRPDGFRYVADGVLTSPTALPWFVDHDARRPTSKTLPAVERIQKGLRQSSLKKRAFQLVQAADSFPELVADLLAFRDWELEHPEEFTNAWVENLAQWFWDKREAGELWHDRNSGVFIRRFAINELARRGEGLALLVYTVIVSLHGHHPGKQFALVPDGLRKSGRIKAGREQLYQAIHLLVELGLLDRWERRRGKRVFYRYQIGTPWTQEKSRGGSFLTLVPETGTSRTSARMEGSAA